MALTANERKQRQLARDEEERRRMPDSTYPFLSQPFFEWLEADSNWQEVADFFELMGVMPPDFNDDSGPADHSIHEIAESYVQDATFGGYERSVGRAELMAELLIGASASLSGLVNRFKKEELAKRLTTLEAEDLADPDRRRAAMAEIAQITRLQAELQKNVRYTFPQWKIKGV